MRNTKRVEINVFGRVQGVFFRGEAQKVAKELGLTGWTKNDTDGSVRIIAEGDEGTLQKFMEWCRKGTAFSKVENIEVEWKGATNEFNDFKIK